MVRGIWIAAIAAPIAFACKSKSPPAGDDDAGAAAAASPADARRTPPPNKPPRPERTEHAVFDLVANRHAAHVYNTGDLVLDAADIGFARYTRFGVPKPHWHIGHRVDGVRASIADRRALLEVPFDGTMAGSVDRLEARVHGKAKQWIALRVNGRAAGKSTKTSRVSLATDGWQTIAIPVEPGRWATGENEIYLETGGKPRGKIAYEWLRFATKNKTIDGDPRKAATFDATSRTISLGLDSTLVWYVTIPDGANLVAGVDGSCTVDVRATTSDDSFVGGVLGEDRSRIDLTKLTDRVVGLTLTARDCPMAQIKAPEIRLHGKPPAAPPKAKAPKYIVLWIMDALRADKVPTFTPGARAKTPNLDELAKTSTIFRQYYVQGNESQTSHSTMWTGLYPAVHDVRMAGRGGTWRIEDKFAVLAEKLKAAGMYTAAVTGNGFVNEDGGYARGFDEFRNMMREKGVKNGLIYGETIVDTALARFDAHRDRPLYLCLGTIDTHGPWVARKPWIDEYSPNYDGPFQEFATAKELGFRKGSMGCHVIPPKPEIERLRAIYDSDISYQDQQVGRVVAKLKDWGIWDQTLLAITADHGEEMFEDQRCGHGGSLRDSLIRVPLLIHDPSRFPGGAVVEEGAEATDLMPTFLDAMGAPIDGAIQGASLIGLANGVGRGWPRPSYASMYEYAHAMRIGRWKIRVGTRGVPIVGDLVADPGETADLKAKHPVERRMLTDNLGLFLALREQWHKRTWGVTTAVTPAGAAALDEAQTP